LVLSPRVGRVGNVLEPVHDDRFEQDVVRQTWRNRDIHRDTMFSKRTGIGNGQFRWRDLIVAADQQRELCRSRNAVDDVDRRQRCPLKLPLKYRPA
jgi:hypothetical protein